MDKTKIPEIERGYYNLENGGFVLGCQIIADAINGLAAAIRETGAVPMPDMQAQGTVPAEAYTEEQKEQLDKITCGLEYIADKRANMCGSGEYDVMQTTTAHGGRLSLAVYFDKGWFAVRVTRTQDFIVRSADLQRAAKAILDYALTGRTENEGHDAADDTAFNQLYDKINAILSGRKKEGTIEIQGHAFRIKKCMRAGILRAISANTGETVAEGECIEPIAEAIINYIKERRMP